MGEAKCQLFIEAPPPRILSDLVDQTVIEGSDFTLEIKAIGEIAEYAWFKDGIIIKPCEEFQMGRDTEKIWLKIASSLLKDSGAYSVSISNGVDIMESSCNVTIELNEEFISYNKAIDDELAQGTALHNSAECNTGPLTSWRTECARASRGPRRG